MAVLGLYWASIGIMENKMETTICGLLLRAHIPYWVFIW